MVYLELVPREKLSFIQDAEKYIKKYSLEGINVPHISRVSLNSYQAAHMLLDKNLLCIPHIKANFASKKDHISMIRNLVEKGLSKVLVVSGDIPSNLKNNYDTSAIDLIKIIKLEFPSLKVFAAFDPYRTSLIKEFEYTDQKRAAGVDGFFSQPFFDLRFLEFCLDYFRSDLFFAGISPVISSSSQVYWQQRNKVFFPNEFSLDLDFNIVFGKKVINLTKKYEQNIYLMPIKVDIDAYLQGIFKTPS